ncbi:type II secretion system protein GspD [Tichowtungia aerotolerans]|uniref:Type II/III secretion system secretin-like domain-containing protein n=1 Tax=Tichowtungia aerotolerans TaxID=2697043 RepID=A0A6P1MBZ4_9BACT|nr:hypothetical protein [Tichowtungia aerotolerans]QHI69608.1 hypothetical protein GT409_09105 [Tichowtungia aerotolerans]
MKRIILIFCCIVSAAAFAQQRPEGTGQRRKLSAEQIAALKARKAEQDNGASSASMDAEAAAAADENQEKYDDIMGSFSELAMQFSREEESSLDLFVYECRHISAESFARAVEPFLSVNGEISDCEEADLVVISDEKKQIPQLKKIAESIDRPVRQVLVSASVVEFQVTDGFEKEISLQYNQFKNMGALDNSASGAAAVSDAMEDIGSRVLDAFFPTGVNPATLSGQSSAVYYDQEEQLMVSGFLTFLDSSGTAQILSAPSLVMRRGHTGNILSGEDIPITKSTQNSAGTNYSVDYKSVGIKLWVTPESIFNDRVVLEVKPEVSNIIRYEESAAGRNPVIAIRNASTMLEMNDGFMVSIGGLLREEQIESQKQVPILGSIPLVGTLFRSSSSEKIRSQLVIFLTVNIVDPADLSVDTIADEIPPKLQEQVDASRQAFPPQKRSVWGGIKKLFR